MASEETVRKSLKIINKLTRIFGQEIESFPVMFDSEGKIITKWEGGGRLVEARKRGPGTMERIYRELPRETLLRFVVPTKAPVVEPTQKEWEEFEANLFTAARRVTIRKVREQFKKPMSKLPQPTKRKRGRPKLKQERVRLVRETIEKWLDSGECKTTTDAVKKAAEFFGDPGPSLHVDTIWRYLRAANRGRKPSTKPSAR
ncbi:MAG TPA: hypothetical protein VE778_06200 [Candidatus Bathyarchaeia archaeon]|jgi:hypothetical protein|nr:hypothetical protein [Candidatus Bathyarchaeia archaeon]